MQRACSFSVNWIVQFHWVFSQTESLNDIDSIPRRYDKSFGLFRNPTMFEYFNTLLLWRFHDVFWAWFHSTVAVRWNETRDRRVDCWMDFDPRFIGSARTPAGNEQNQWPKLLSREHLDWERLASSHYSWGGIITEWWGDVWAFITVASCWMRHFQLPVGSQYWSSRTASSIVKPLLSF